VEPTELTLTVGETGQITATVEPSNASNKKVNWTTSDADIASVDQNGLVTAIAEGSATITATTVDGSKTATCEVTVNAETVTRTAAPTRADATGGTALEEYVFAEGTLTISGPIAEIPNVANPADVTAQWVGVNIPRPTTDVAESGTIHLTIKEDGKDDVVHESVSYGEGDPFLYYFGAKENGRTQTLEIVWNGTHKETLVIKYVDTTPAGPETVTRTAAPTRADATGGTALEEYVFAEGTLTISGPIAEIPNVANPADVTAQWVGVNIPRPTTDVAESGTIHLTIKEDGKDDVVHESVSYGEGDPFLYYFGAKENGRTQTLEIVWNGTHKETLVIKYVDTTPVVAPTITLDGVPTSDVTTEIKATEDANGLVTGFDTTDRTPIQVTLTKGSADYSNVRVVVEGVSDGIQLIAQDTAGNWYNIVKAGWGSSDGFALENATTPVYLVANTAGTYTATIKLVDVSNSNAELATATASVTAVQQ
jgi:hypothetical protein